MISSIRIHDLYLHSYMTVLMVLNKIIYSIYDNHIKVIENYTKYCATSIARKHKSNKNKTNTKQQ